MNPIAFILPLAFLLGVMNLAIGNNERPRR